MKTIYYAVKEINKNGRTSIEMQVIDKLPKGVCKTWMGNWTKFYVGEASSYDLAIYDNLESALEHVREYADTETGVVLNK